MIGRYRDPGNFKIWLDVVSLNRDGLTLETVRKTLEADLRCSRQTNSVNRCPIISTVSRNPRAASAVVLDVDFLIRCNAVGAPEQAIMPLRCLSRPRRSTSITR